MSSMSEDIQCASSDTRPPMLDRTDFESWQQRIRLYCLGKDNGENIMKSINEGPFHMGTVSDVIAAGTEDAFQQGPTNEVQQYPTQSSKSPQSSNEPSPADNFQLDSGSSSTENLIESLSTHFPPTKIQSYKSHLPTNNPLERRLMQGTKLRFKTAELWFKMSVEDIMRIIKKTFYEKQCKRKCCS
ncbi:hypothetical protein Tco_0281671 [Tanacetum coccineum]